MPSEPETKRAFAFFDGQDLFYFGAAKPNRAYEVLAGWEARGADPDGRGGLLKVLITQNIDSVQLN
jgi:hypothetical protein